MTRPRLQHLQWLHGLERFGMDLSLDRMEKLLALLGNPHRGLRCIHIAGTNGKGSVTAMLYAILRKAGYSVGMYTSPHLVEFNERIKVDEKLISDRNLDRLAKKIRPHAGKTRCTYFEAITVIAFLYFREQRTDYAVCEVGLGGRLDATNVIIPEVSVITNVGLEHTAHLGNTAEKIAAEKAGIIKRGVPVVTAARGKALGVIRAVARERQSPVVVARRSPYRTNMRGDFQKMNAGAAVAAARLLRQQGVQLPESAIRAGLRRVDWPGRMEFNGNILIDCAHNPDGVRVLARELRKLRRKKRIVLLVGMLADKDYASMIRVLEPLAETVIATKPPTARAAEPGLVRSAMRNPGKATCIADPAEAFVRGCSMAGDDALLVITGSIYTAGALYNVARSARL